MADPSTIAILIAGGSLTVTVVREIISMTRTTVKETEGARVLIAAEIAKLREEFRMEHDQEMHRNGEAAAAIRAKVGEVEKELPKVELWVRDNCVRISHFEGTVTQLNRSIELLAIDIKEGFRRIDDKLEKIKLNG